LKVHFSGLDSLRFYAALCVVLAHLENQFEVHPWFVSVIARFTLDAQSAVTFFFVLSGFLITYFLLTECITRGKINTRAFYLRRVLRIIPLYYLIVAIGLGLFPWLFGASYPLTNLSYLQLILVLLLMPNLTSLSAPLAHLWTIGVEQQFYFMWPWAVRHTRRLLQFIFGIVFLKIILTLIVLQMSIPGMLYILEGLRFECMALGSLVAWLYVERQHTLRYLYHPLMQGAALCIIAFVIVIEVPMVLPIELVSSCAFAILILNIATNPRAIFRFSTFVTERLGKISYGIYMYHFPLVFLTVVLLGMLGMSSSVWYPILLYVISLASTLLVATISYLWFEQPILNLQRRPTKPGAPEITMASQDQVLTIPYGDKK
jgi:peptidoglycan/LPS O-acetylase OafA/YrhL